MHRYKYFTRNNESSQGKFKIYISYSYVDGGKYALEFAHKLADEFDCVVIFNESPSDRPIYENAENKHLESSNLMVLVATPKALMSESVRVNDVSAARQFKIPIVAVSPEDVNISRLCNLIGSPYCIKMNSNRYEELFRKIFSALILPPKEIEMLNGFILNLPAMPTDAERYAAGKAYYLGKNMDEACRWLSEAASGENKHIKMLACHMLGIAFYLGLGIKQSFENALAWFSQSSDYAASSFMIGYMYETGEGKAANYPAAVNYYSSAAEKGDRDAQYVLGFIYYQGSGVEKDKSLAVKWYTQSAKNGNAKAQYVLAVLYDIGNDVRQNKELAMKLYECAAKQGHKGAEAAIRDNDETFGTVYRPARKTDETRKSKKSGVSKVLTILSFFPGLIFLSLPFSVPGIFISYFEKKTARMCANIICALLSLAFFAVIILYLCMR